MVQKALIEVYLLRTPKRYLERSVQKWFVLQEGIESRATQSVRVPVKNLTAVSPNLNVSLLQEAVGWQFLRTNVLGEDEGFEAASNQRGFHTSFLKIKILFQWVTQEIAWVSFLVSAKFSDRLAAVLLPVIKLLPDRAASNITRVHLHS